MLIVTTEAVAGHDVVETKGECFGIVVRSRGALPNIAAGLRSIFGGEITQYTRMLEDTRREALNRLGANAAAMGANAVVMMRFDSSEIAETMSEVVAYGTAVVVRPRAGSSPATSPWAAAS
ncbi:MAG: heavy metal-binding domain-containing protein [Acetobacteraceae bacterium]|nr:heavy metal-binding domain-containing protein [Acetobacteraceae bacterium]